MHVSVTAFWTERALLTAVPRRAWVEPGAHSWAVLEQVGWVPQVRLPGRVLGEACSLRHLYSCLQRISVQLPFVSVLQLTAVLVEVLLITFSKFQDLCFLPYASTYLI